jgi:UPF0042 nucleotide-binding protein
VDDIDGTALRCTVSSFGYKHGPHADADWVIDVRFLDNPFWVPELRPMTGLEEPVREFVMRQAAAGEFVERLGGLLGWTLERGRDHGRDGLHVAVGCTGGRHRSVVMAEALAQQLRQQGIEVDLRHRDVERPDPR